MPTLPQAVSVRVAKVLLFLVIATILIATLHQSRASETIASTISSIQASLRSDVTLVVPSMSGDDTSWVSTFSASWNVALFVVDSDTAAYTVPTNKGHEGMAYLTYIIDHYDKLSPVTVFHHSNRYQWHTDDPAFDSVRQLQRLQITHVKDQGYVNLRCNWNPGCPVSYPVYNESGLPDDGPMTLHYPEMYEFIFNQTAPVEAGQPCCAEFAVADWRIRERPKAIYVRARRWLLETWMIDGMSGRMMEYLWHILFGMPALYCPDAQECYCKTYGLCDLECTTERCEGMWEDPMTHGHFYSLPEGWPDVDLEGNWQNASNI